MLRTDLELYVSDNNGEVVCGDHTWPSDIHRWTRLSMEEASEWVAFIRSETERDEPCEMCDVGEAFVGNYKGWRPS